MWRPVKLERRGCEFLKDHALNKCLSKKKQRFIGSFNRRFALCHAYSSSIQNMLISI